MVRLPAVSGQFYPADRETLSHELDLLIPQGGDKIKAVGAICPHAGYMFSGSIAGEVYSGIQPAGTYVILSPNHNGCGARFSVSCENWKTPLGEVAVDTELIDSIMGKTDLLANDASAHSEEHSIEVQLPFIQRISPGAKIVPITVQFGAMPEITEIGCSIAEAVKELKRDVVIISSSDMTHYESREAAQKKDKMALDKVLGLDARGLMEVVLKNNISMCGCVSSAIMIIAAKELGAQRAELVKYSDSGAVLNDTSQVVGYAGVVVY